MPIRAIVLDIDSTLAPGISWTALTEGLGASPEEHLRIYDDYRTGKISYEESKKRLIGLWRATGNANRQFFEDLFTKRPLRPEANDVVGALQKRYRICLITGSMDAYAVAVAKRLGVEDYYANTTLHWDSSGQLADYDYDLNQAELKLKQLDDFCKKYGLSPHECAVVGDSDNDLLLFKATGHGVLFVDSEADALSDQAKHKITNLAELLDLL